MQWASSTANRDILTPDSARVNDLALNRSGAMYASFSLPAARASNASDCLAQDCELFIMSAGIPRALRASTWSFISAMSGDITMVTPSSSMAGSW